VIPLRRISALVVALLTLAVVGCGGSEAEAPQVPGPPASVTLPNSGESPTEAAASAQNRDTGDDSTTTDGDTSTSDDTSTDTGTTDSTGTDTGATTPDSSGGTSAPDTGADSETNDTAPPAGSGAEQFEDFCAQNQGAC
jgi:hypothetical protein